MHYYTIYIYIYIYIYMNIKHVFNIYFSFPMLLKISEKDKKFVLAFQKINFASFSCLYKCTQNCFIVP